MGKYSVFIDGAAGTTGLRIHQRLATQPDIELVALPEAQRKNLEARVEAARAADVTVLCLPDDAAREIAAAAGPAARICDASTAHRTQAGWVYGMPELFGQRRQIADAARVAVPGCHASGFVLLCAPLVQAGALVAGTPLVCQSLTGYSGGGKAMIAAYESGARPPAYDSCRLYALGLAHKHLPEMALHSGLGTPPAFTPTLGDYYSGMLVSLPLHAAWLNDAWRSRAKLVTLLTDYYACEPLVRVHKVGDAPPDGTLAANALAGSDAVELFVLGNDEMPLLAAQYDNLGKGACGAAIQCVNLMLGREELAGLEDWFSE